MGERKMMEEMEKCEDCDKWKDRDRLPPTRRSLTHKFRVCGHEGYVIIGLYENGQPGEMFIRLAKAGSTTRGFVESLSIMTSLALQHGAPLEQICDKMCGMKFEPMDDKSTSVVDCVFSWMRDVFINRTVTERDSEILPDDAEIDSR